MKQIIIINGTGGSGKDTFVEFVSKYIDTYNFSSIDKVKEIAKMIGWSGTKSEKDRKFLSDLKKLTTEYNDMAFHSIEDGVRYFLSSNQELMFIHIREPEEIQRVVTTFQAKTLLIKREGLDNIKTNDSDANVDQYSYDYIIPNTTLEELEKSAENFVESLQNQVPAQLKKELPTKC